MDSQIAYGGGGECLADGLGALDEEPPGPIAARAAQQLACCDHARGALGAGRFFVEPECSGRGPVLSGVPVLGGHVRPGHVDESGERGGLADGQLGQDLAVDLDPAALRPWMNRLYVMPFWRAAALIRVIHSCRKSPFLARRSR